MNPKKITASCSKTYTTLTELRKSLCKMKAAGSKGFEGLLRDLFERLLEQSIYLMKSGSQGGGDAYSGTFPDSLSIVWEDKRYQRKTVLPVDQLVSKLDQAARTYPEMDIWVPSVLG